MSLVPPVKQHLNSKDISQRYQLNEKLINEEFKIWKKTSPLLYDLVYSYCHTSPVLSLQWLPNYSKNEINGVQYVQPQFLVGSNNSNTSNSIKLMSVQVPSSLENGNTFNTSTPKLSDIPKNIKTERQWVHPGAVNKVSLNPFSNLFASQSNSGDIFLFDINDNNSNSHKSTLKFHTKEGMGLEWNPNFDKSQLLSCAEDAKIALWDLSTSKANIKPSRVFNTHNNIVNDISWNRHQDNLFISVSDDSSYQLHDLRSNNDSTPIIHVTSAHHNESNNIDYPITSVDFSDSIPSLFATGGLDNSIQLWDLRNPTTPLRKLHGHTGGIMSVKLNKNYLMSTSLDRRIMIWDLNKLEEGEIDKRKSDHVDPCLSFIHGGHTGKVLDADWHPNLDQLFVSCADDDLIEIWKPAQLGAEYETEDDSNDIKME